MAKYTLMKTEGHAKRAQFETVHGEPFRLLFL